MQVVEERENEEAGAHHGNDGQVEDSQQEVAVHAVVDSGEAAAYDKYVDACVV